jgi:hypothetical protein
MRKLLIILGLASFILACQPSNEALISGTITNPVGDKVYVEIHGQDKPVTLSIDSAGYFEGRIQIEDAIYGRISNGKAKLPAYINAGVELKVAFDVKDVAHGDYSNVKIEGDKVKETQMMVNYYQNQMFPSSKELFILSPIDFKNKIKEAVTHNEKLIDDFVSVNTDLDKHFVDLFKIQIQLGLASSYFYYPMYHSMFAPNDKSPVPADFNFMIDRLPKNDLEVYNKVPRYKPYEVTIWTNQILEKIAPFREDTEKYFNSYVDEIIKLDIHSEIKEDVANNLLANNYKPAPDNIKEIFRARYKEILVNPKYIANIEKVMGINKDI